MVVRATIHGYSGGMKRSILLCLCVLFISPILAPAQEATPSEEAALQAYREGAFSRAVQLYTRALSETDDPGHRARLHVNIAWTLFALGRETEPNDHRGQSVSSSLAR